MKTEGKDIVMTIEPDCNIGKQDSVAIFPLEQPKRSQVASIQLLWITLNNPENLVQVGFKSGLEVS